MAFGIRKFVATPLRRDHHAPGAAQGPPDERQGRDAGLRLFRQGHDREQVCGGADEDVSETYGKIRKVVNAF